MQDFTFNSYKSLLLYKRAFLINPNLPAFLINPNLPECWGCRQILRKKSRHLKRKKKKKKRNTKKITRLQHFRNIISKFHVKIKIEKLRQKLISVLKTLSNRKLQYSRNYNYKLKDHRTQFSFIQQEMQQ